MARSTDHLMKPIFGRGPSLGREKAEIETALDLIALLLGVTRNQ